MRALPFLGHPEKHGLGFNAPCLARSAFQLNHSDIETLMIDIVATILLHFGIVTGFALVVRFSGQPVRVRPLIGGLACTAVYWIIIVLSSELQGMIVPLANLRWNWLGKICAVAATLFLVGAVRSLTRQEAGLVLKIRAGSIGPALLVMAALCSFAWLLEAMAHDGTDRSRERLIFQATMPGLDEELFVRGLLLALFVRAFGQGRIVSGAPFGAAEVALTFLFAAGHGLRVADGAIAFDAAAFVTTAVLSAGLTWLRQRTGSVVPSILAHNAINVGNSFF